MRKKSYFIPQCSFLHSVTATISTHFAIEYQHEIHFFGQNCLNLLKKDPKRKKLYKITNICLFFFTKVEGSIKRRSVYSLKKLACDQLFDTFNANSI